MWRITKMKTCIDFMSFTLISILQLLSPVMITAIAFGSYFLVVHFTGSFILGMLGALLTGVGTVIVLLKLFGVKMFTDDYYDVEVESKIHNSSKIMNFVGFIIITTLRLLSPVIAAAIAFFALSSWGIIAGIIVFLLSWGILSSVFKSWAEKNDNIRYRLT